MAMVVVVAEESHRAVTCRTEEMKLVPGGLLARG